MPDSVLDGLDPEQRLVAESLSGALLVHAGAGAGKTRAITHRIAHAVQTGRHSPRSALAVTFTNRAAGEMRGRLAQLGVPGVTVRTFHAAALSQLRHFWPRTMGGPLPELVSSKVALVDRACRELGVQAGRTTLRDLASEIEWAGSSMLVPGSYVQAAQTAGRTAIGSGAETLDLPDIARALAAYQSVKERRNVIDFEDVLLSTIALLGDRPDVADEVRAVYRWFTVDEYQDITPAQEALLSAWVGDRDDVCAVGDPSQTIYSFAGADPASMGRFLRRWPAATVVSLDRCYRCTPQIVRVANEVVRVMAPTGAEGLADSGQASEADPAGEVRAADSASSARGPLLLRSQRETGVAPVLITAADDAEEARLIAQRIGGLIDEGYRRSDIAILVRTNGMFEAHEAALGEAGIPCVLHGAERFFERAEVREAVVRLRGQAATSRGSEVPSSELGQLPLDEGTPGGSRPSGRVGSPGEASEGGEPEPAGSAGSSGRAPGAAAPDGPLVAGTIAVLTSMGWQADAPPGGRTGRERWESLAALVGLARELEASGTTSLADLVAEMERRAALSHAPSADAVTVSTLHAAKGLEWRAVFLAGASEGLLPISYADTDERLAEEQRLFYVGITRAQDQLFVSWALTRNGGGRHREPSRFLALVRRRGGLQEVGQRTGVIRQGRGTGRPERRRRSPSRCRVCGAGLVTGPERTLGRCRTCPAAQNEALLEVLKQWRRREAATRSIPAFVVFSDVTLQAISERVPQTDSELLAIPGIGAVKLDLYGEALRGLLAEHRAAS